MGGNGITSNFIGGIGNPQNGFNNGMGNIMGVAPIDPYQDRLNRYYE